MIQSALKNPVMTSSLAASSVIAPSSAKRKKSIVTALTITSLVDAFCMIVIYLMFNMSPSQEAADMKVINIPQAQNSEMFTSGVVIRVDGERFFVNEEPTAKQDLVAKLSAFKVGPETPVDQMPSIIIQADRELNFSSFNPIILAGAQNGITTFKFAVINGGKE